jgi:NAD(P)-dependent dehydrogenase (short-subunit alcohol dehydrogenase family)
VKVVTTSQPPVVLVTGASRGLGRGIAVHLSAMGFSIGVNYAGNADAARETVALCEARRRDGNQRFLPLQADIGSASERTRLLNQTLEGLGRLDALVNNAGMGPRVRADITETSLESFREVLAVNLEGPFFLTQAVARHWLQAKPAPLLAQGFAVVNISSISANTASPNRGEYCVSKAGLSMVTQLWAVRLAEAGIQVYEVRPGVMATDMTRGVKEKYDRLLAEGLVPQHRWGTADDVGRAVGALLTGVFPYSTGEVIYVDGGFHLRRL